MGRFVKVMRVDARGRVFRLHFTDDPTEKTRDEHGQTNRPKAIRTTTDAERERQEEKKRRKRKKGDKKEPNQQPFLSTIQPGR